ncbi:MAG: hypothetical protein NT031_21035 [Planctomycetota bacterium]|nr:hypothetical protein [Planctomycetota bacterium]
MTYSNLVEGVHTAFGLWGKSITSVKVVDTTAPRDKARNFTWKAGDSAPAPDLTILLL